MGKRMRVFVIMAIAMALYLFLAGAFWSLASYVDVDGVLSDLVATIEVVLGIALLSGGVMFFYPEDRGLKAVIGLGVTAFILIICGGLDIISSGPLGAFKIVSGGILLALGVWLALYVLAKTLDKTRYFWVFNAAVLLAAAGFAAFAGGLDIVYLRMPRCCVGGLFLYVTITIIPIGLRVVRWLRGRNQPQS